MKTAFYKGGIVISVE